MTTPAGPGKFSQRTDKAVGNANANLPNAGYGENKDFQEAKSGMNSGGGLEAAPQMSMQQLFSGMGQNSIPLSAESTMPNVPVTDGAAMGPGAGTEALASGPPPASKDQLKASMVALEWMANQPNRSDAARIALMKAKAELGM